MYTKCLPDNIFSPGYWDKRNEWVRFGRVWCRNQVGNDLHKLQCVKVFTTTNQRQNKNNYYHLVNSRVRSLDQILE